MPYVLECTCILLYRVVKLQFGSRLAGVLAPAPIFSNPSIMYMSIVPMMEAPFIMFFVLSVYYIQRWYYEYVLTRTVNDNNKTSANVTGYKTAFKCALAISAATLTRYEGWLIPFMFIVILLMAFCITRKERMPHNRRMTKIVLVIAILVSFSGIMFWVSWNIVYFKDPFVLCFWTLLCPGTVDRL